MTKGTGNAGRSASAGRTAAGAGRAACPAVLVPAHREHPRRRRPGPSNDPALHEQFEHRVS
ncbi:hypothetical protein [Streptomyces cellulosae]|uniref:Uncharacterized protein n=1 Tax=Streptomyces cellulosae TaxID=1968 RepID=A0ABW7XZ77_STRCE